jgi:hypothetical protein
MTSLSSREKRLLRAICGLFLTNLPSYNCAYQGTRGLFFSLVKRSSGQRETLRVWDEMLDWLACILLIGTLIDPNRC